MDPIHKIAQWFRDQQTKPRQCRYDGAYSSPRTGLCENRISNEESKRLGHPGYCSMEHAYLAQEDAPM